MNRRDYLKVSAAGVAGTAIGLSVPTDALAIDQSIDAITAGKKISTDDRIDIQLPDRAENGAVVPVRIQSSIPNTNKLVVLIDKHEQAHVATTEFFNGADPVFSVHVRLDVPCNVVALVHDGSNWYSHQAPLSEVQHSCVHE